MEKSEQSSDAKTPKGKADIYNRVGNIITYLLDLPKDPNNAPMKGLIEILNFGEVKNALTV